MGTKLLKELISDKEYLYILSNLSFGCFTFSFKGVFKF